MKITQDTINLLKDETETINVSVSKNGTVFSPQPVIEWTIENGSICSVDNNIITALSVGETTVDYSFMIGSKPQYFYVSNLLLFYRY